MNLRAPNSEPAREKRGAAMKFTYASGSRPVEGYTVKRGVGRGGFGEVYYGTSDAGKEVALKLIRRNLDVELRGVKHCLNLKHPNLIALYDIRTDELDDRWVVMEYVSGESLEDAIERNPNGMPEEEVLRWMHGICAGVAYLHDHGIVHRDLKPGNIFSDEGVVKIGDYGLSKFISCSRRSGQTESVGTVHYMAPEISNGRYGREIDTYALGIILFEMLTGHVPFEGESVGEVLMKHLTAEPDLTRLTPPYRGIVERALTKDPELRLNSVGELRALLPPATESTHAGFTIPVQRSPVKSLEDDLEAATAAVTQDEHDEYIEVTEDEEPVLKAVRNAWNSVERQWTASSIPPILRVAIIGCIVVLLAVTVEAWIAGLFVAFVIYGIYWTIRAVVIQPEPKKRLIRKPRPEAKPVPVATADFRDETINQPQVDPPVRPARTDPSQQRRHRRQHRKSHREQLSRLVARKSDRTRLTELMGSMLVSPVIVAIVALIALVLSGNELSWPNYAWLTVVGVLTSWAVMMPAKFFEGRIDDQSPKRFIMLVMGVLVGLAAFTLDRWLYVDLPYNQDLTAPIGDTLTGEVFPSLVAKQGRGIPLELYLGYFGGLFLIVRWWAQTEWARGTRLSLWSVFVCVGFAYLMHLLWHFPQPAGMLVAGVAAVSIQFSSPWLSKRRQRDLLQKVA